RCFRWSRRLPLCVPTPSCRTRTCCWDQVTVSTRRLPSPMRMDYPGPMSRVLGYVRLSRLTSETTSPARQREVIERWVKHEGHDLIDIVSDLDVSGAKSPLERPELGPRLTTADGFDILAAAKLDRLSRSAADVHDLLRWADEKG